MKVTRFGWNKSQLRGFATGESLYDQVLTRMQRPRKKKFVKSQKNMIVSRPRDDPGNLRGRTRYAEYNHPPNLPPETKKMIEPQNLKSLILKTREVGKILARKPDYSALDRPYLLPIAVSSVQSLPGGFADAKAGILDKARQGYAPVHFGPSSGINDLDEALNILAFRPNNEPKPISAESEKPTVNVAYRKLIESNLEGDVETSLKLFDALDPLFVSERRRMRAQASTVRMLMRARGPDESAKFVEEKIIAPGKEVGAEVVCALLNGCMERHDPARARRIWDSLWNRYDFQKTTAVYHCLTKLASMEGNGYEAYNLVFEFESRVLDPVLLRLLDLNNQSEWMEAQLTRSIYHYAMRACARKEDTARKTFEIYSKMKTLELPGNEETLTHLMTACSSLGDVGLAKQMWQEFRKENPKATIDVVGYNSLLGVHASQALWRRKKPLSKLKKEYIPQTPRVDEAKELIKILTFLPKDTLFNPHLRKLLRKEAEEMYVREEERRIENLEKEEKLYLAAAEKARSLPDSAFDFDLDDSQFSEEDDLELMPDFEGAKYMDYPVLENQRSMRMVAEPEVEAEADHDIDGTLKSLRKVLEVGTEDDEEIDEILRSHKENYLKQRQAPHSESIQSWNRPLHPLEPVGKTPVPNLHQHSEDKLMELFASESGMPQALVREMVTENASSSAERREIVMQLFDDLGYSEDNVQLLLSKSEKSPELQTNPLHTLSFENHGAEPQMDRRSFLNPTQGLPFKELEMPYVDKLNTSDLALREDDAVAPLESFSRPLDENRAFSDRITVEHVNLTEEQIEADFDEMRNELMPHSTEEPIYLFGLFSQPDEWEFRFENQPQDVYKAALDIFEAMVERYKIQPDVASVNTMLRLYANGHRLTRLEETFGTMFKEHGLKPNHISYRTMVQTYVETKRLDLAELYFEEAKNLAGDISKMDYRTLGSMMEGFATFGRLEDALEILMVMKRNNMYISERWVFALRNKLTDAKAKPEVLALIPENPHEWKRPDIVKKIISKGLSSKFNRRKIKKVTGLTHSAIMRTKR